MWVTNCRIGRIQTKIFIYNTAPKYPFKCLQIQDGQTVMQRGNCPAQHLHHSKWLPVKYTIDSIFIIFPKDSFTVSLYSKPWYIPTVIIIHSAVLELVGCETRGKKGHTRMWAFSVRQAGRELIRIGFLTRWACLVVTDPPCESLPKPWQGSPIGNIPVLFIGLVMIIYRPSFHGLSGVVYWKWIIFKDNIWLLLNFSSNLGN